MCRVSEAPQITMNHESQGWTRTRTLNHGPTMRNWGLQEADEGDEQRDVTDSGSEVSVASGSDREGIELPEAEESALAGSLKDECLEWSPGGGTLGPLVKTQVI